MTWNYRIIAVEDEHSGENYFSLHEVFYDDDGNIEAWTEDPINFGGDTPDELLRSLIMALSDATKYPVLKEVEPPAPGLPALEPLGWLLGGPD